MRLIAILLEIVNVRWPSRRQRIRALHMLKKRHARRTMESPDAWYVTRRGEVVYAHKTTKQSKASTEVQLKKRRRATAYRCRGLQLKVKRLDSALCVCLIQCGPLTAL
mmetsp:Transcript_31177/g.75810  ORF Transcript_31177/g.75810 Transcript_31177/m.75810 type:complete len:108 (-) Transcript_31177:1019-1342(-)